MTRILIALNILMVIGAIIILLADPKWPILQWGSEHYQQPDIKNDSVR